MSHVRFTHSAKKDLGEIYKYIAQDNIAAADRHRARLEQRWQVLIDQPRIGRKRDEIQRDLRSIAEGNYVIFYRILGKEVQIARVRHRDPQVAFAQTSE